MLLFSIKGSITDFWLNISSGVSVQFLVTISKENQNDLVTNHPSITLCWRTISLGVIAGDRGISSLKVPQFAWSLIIVINHLIFLAATTQLYEWYFYLPVCLSVVCPSVCLSVCPSHFFDYVPIIASSWNFQELSPRIRVTFMQKVKVRGQRSRSQWSQPNLIVSGL